MSAGIAVSGQRRSIIVAVCTYRRNDLLARLLEALVVCAEAVRDQAAVGVALVDDTSEGCAREVAQVYEKRFELGISYRISGKQNIAIARNLTLDDAIDRADFVALTDDDCEPPLHWLAALLQTLQTSRSDAATGRMIRRVPDSAPAWIRDEPFLELGVDHHSEGEWMTSGATFNTLLSAKWLVDHPEVRFDPHFGVIGGEDVVFFRQAVSAGLHIAFSEKGYTYENEPPERANLAYQLYVYLWHGNSAALSSLRNGVSRLRFAVHAGASLMRALVRPVRRLMRGESAQMRFALAQVLHAIGKFLGICGLKIRHR